MHPDSDSSQSPGHAALSNIRPVAAIASHSVSIADAIIDTVVNDLQQAGYRVVGLRQHSIDNGKERCAVQLQSIQTGEQHPVMQQLGSGSVSCTVDPGALELLAEALSQELDTSVDLVIINRFGKRESEGAGFRSVIERAMELELPVLTVVKENLQDAWLDYGGECVSVLPAVCDDVMRWYRTISVARATHP